MLKEIQKIELKGIVESSLDRAEKIFKDVGEIFLDKADSEMLKEARSLPTQIPGYPEIEADVPHVGRFIALMVDIRNSTNHLLQRISSKTAAVSEEKRLFFETSALLPAFSRVVSYEDGRVTEYLGDGALSLFHVKDANSPADSLYAVHRVAKNAFQLLEEVVNPELKKDILCLRWKLELGSG